MGKFGAGGIGHGIPDPHPFTSRQVLLALGMFVVFILGIELAGQLAFYIIDLVLG